MSRRWVEQRGAMRNGPFTCFKWECACNPTYVRCDSNNLWRCPRCANLSIWYECASLPYVLAGGYMKKNLKKVWELMLGSAICTHTLLWCFVFFIINLFSWASLHLTYKYGLKWNMLVIDLERCWMAVWLLFFLPWAKPGSLLLS